MKKVSSMTLIFGAVVLTLSLAWADHHETPAGAEGMPPMGPPVEIESMAHMVGTWDVAMEMRTEPTAEFTTGKGEAVFQYVLGGAVTEMKYSSTFMDMPFEGRGYTAFNRETGKWQSIWMDNMGARISMYEGVMEGDKMILHGEDYMYGQKWLSRITQTHVNDSTFNWQMEHSTDDGATWNVYMKSVYTRRG